MLKKNKYIWIYGYHSAISALNNPNRTHKELFVTNNFHKKHSQKLKEICNTVKIKIVSKQEISALFPENTAHQNIALYTSEIPAVSIEQITSNNNEYSVIVMLDQITDTGNIGAIIRSAVAFNATAIILTKHTSPNKSTILKSASGTLEFIPLIYVNNLINTIKYAKSKGYWCYGMDENSTISLPDIQFDKKTLIILGSEESGLRKLTREHCDYIVKIPTSNKIHSLNVSNAAAITLYSSYLSHKKSLANNK